MILRFSADISVLATDTFFYLLTSRGDYLPAENGGLVP